MLVRWIGLAAAGMVGLLGVAGCGGSVRPQSVRPATPSGRTSSAGASPTRASAQSAAAEFFRAWGSYDAIRDGPGAYVPRCRPLVTAGLARQLVDDRPASADWAAKRRRHEISVIRVAALRRPDGAPVPTPGRVYLRVYADRVTTSARGRSVAPTGITLVVVHRGDRWLVDRVLFV